MRLRKIPIDFLWEGLELSGDIYNDRGSAFETGRSPDTGPVR